MPEVALAVVTGAEGVLLIERVDGTPPLAFPGGKIEPGETPSQATEREVLEETGVVARCVRILGQRVHPDTGATITYVAARAESSGGAPVPALREAVTASWWPVRVAVARLGPSLDERVRTYLDSKCASR